MNCRARSAERLATAISSAFPARRMASQFLRAMVAAPRIPQRHLPSAIVLVSFRQNASAKAPVAWPSTATPISGPIGGPDTPAPMTARADGRGHRTGGAARTPRRCRSRRRRRGDSRKLRRETPRTVAVCSETVPPAQPADATRRPRLGRPSQAVSGRIRVANNRLRTQNHLNECVVPIPRNTGEWRAAKKPAAFAGGCPAVCDRASAFFRTTRTREPTSMGVSAFLPHRVRSLVALLATALVVAGGSAVADQADDDYLAAIGLYKQKKWAFAAKAFDDFLKRHAAHPRAESARLFLGLSLTHQGRFREAREVFREFARRHPNSRELPQVRYRIGECSYMLDDLPAAAKELELFVARHPTHPLNEWALPYLADTQLRLGQADRAIRTFRTALQRFPKGKLAADVRFGLAKALEASGDTEQAVAHYRQIVKDRLPGFAEKAQLSLATLLMRKGDDAAAAREFDRFAELFPDSPDAALARLNAGFAWFRLKRYDTAIERFAEAARDARHATTAALWTGLAHKATGDWPRAVETFRKAFREDDRSDEMAALVYHWADCERRQGHWRAAHDLFAQFLERWPEHALADDAQLLAAECLLLYAEQQPASRREPILRQASDAVHQFFRRFPKSPLLDYARLVEARIAMATGDRQRRLEALAQLEELARRAPAERLRQRARFLAARAAEQLEDHERALALAEPLMTDLQRGRADAELLAVFAIAARSLLAMKQHDRARDAAERLLQLAESQSVSDSGTRITQAGNAVSRLRAEAHALAAVAYGAGNDWDAAEKHWQALGTTGGNVPESLKRRTALQLAEAAYAARRFDAAVRWFTAAAEGSPNEDRPRALSGLGWALAELGRYREAAGAFEKLLAEYPKHALAAEARVKRAECLQAAGDAKAAAEAFQDAFSRLGTDELAFTAGVRAAELLGELGRIDDAEHVYEQLVERFPEHPSLPQVFHAWATLHYRAEHFERSDAIFRQLLKRFPDSELADDARLILAESDLAAGHLEPATKVLEELLQSPKADNRVKRDALFKLIGVATVRKQWKTAEQLADRYLREHPQSPDGPEVRMLRAQARFYLGDVDTARNALLELKQWLQESAPDVAGVHPWAPFVWILLAETEFARKDYEAVRRLADEFARRFPDSPVAFQMDEVVGRSYKQQARFDEAEKYFRRVLQSPRGRNTETAARAQYALADMEFLRKRYDKAVPLYLQVYHGFPFPQWQAAALLYAGVCDEKLGRVEDAARMYALLLQKFPRSEHAPKARERLEALNRQPAAP
ncbi:MAG: tetratricopeptide repeat protein [Planctomycetota bacterium]|nr:MAG: tetratricopeptide repeat protein [Planctomycetota bacterium]